MGIERFTDTDECDFTFASDSIDWSMRCPENSEIRIVTGAGTIEGELGMLEHANDIIRLQNTVQPKHGVGLSNLISCYADKWRPGA